MWISRASSEFWLSTVCVVPCSTSGLVSGTESVSNSGSGSPSILFIVEYQLFWYFRVVCSSFRLARGDAVFGINPWGSVEISDP